MGNLIEDHIAELTDEVLDGYRLCRTYAISFTTVLEDEDACSQLRMQVYLLVQALQGLGMAQGIIVEMDDKYADEGKENSTYTQQDADARAQDPLYGKD